MLGSHNISTECMMYHAFFYNYLNKMTRSVFSYYLYYQTNCTVRLFSTNNRNFVFLSHRHHLFVNFPARCLFAD